MTMEKLLTLLGPLILAYYVASKMAPYYDQPTSKDIANVFEKVAGALLPLLVLAIVRRTEISDELWQVAVLGFIVPIAFYFAVPFVAKLVAGPSVADQQHIADRMLFSSFGGGNRGNLLLVILATSGVVMPEVTPHYVALDLGNLLCVVTLGFLLVDRYADQSAEAKPRLSEIVNGILKSPGFYAAVMVALQLPGLREKHLWQLVTTFDPTIKAVGVIITPFFSFFVFLAIFIRSEHLGDIIKKSPPVLRLFVAAHVAPSIALFVASFYLQSALLASLAVLVVMPPSSYLWARITSKHSSADTYEATYLVPNLFYFIILGFAFLYGLLHL